MPALVFAIAGTLVDRASGIDPSGVVNIRCALRHSPQRAALAPCRGKGKASRFGAARPGDLGEQPGGGDHVTGEEDAVAAIDGGTVAPGLAGMIEGTAAAVHHLATAPALALPKSGEGGTEEALEPQRRRLGPLARPHRHLRLHQLLARRRQRRIGGAEALDPARLVEVGDDEGIATTVL